MLLCNVAAPQIFWAPAMRVNLFALIGVSVLVLIGMWLERILIIWNTLSHSFLPSMDRIFYPTVWDWLFLVRPAVRVRLDVLCCSAGSSRHLDARSQGTASCGGDP